MRGGKRAGQKSDGMQKLKKVVNQLKGREKPGGREMTEWKNPDEGNKN